HLYSHSYPRQLHSFPTRRSSDLELSNMIRHQDDSTVPHEYDLQLKESHINWGASGDAITILLDVSQAVPAAIIGFYVERILAKLDRKSTRLNSSHVSISYAVFCL